MNTVKILLIHVFLLSCFVAPAIAADATPSNLLTQESLLQLRIGQYERSIDSTNTLVSYITFIAGIFGIFLTCITVVVGFFGYSLQVRINENEREARYLVNTIGELHKQAIEMNKEIKTHVQESEVATKEILGLNTKKNKLVEEMVAVKELVSKIQTGTRGTKEVKDIQEQIKNLEKELSLINDQLGRSLTKLSMASGSASALSNSSMVSGTMVYGMPSSGFSDYGLNSRYVGGLTGPIGPPWATSDECIKCGKPIKRRGLLSAYIGNSNLCDTCNGAPNLGGTGPVGS